MKGNYQLNIIKNSVFYFKRVLLKAARFHLDSKFHGKLRLCWRGCVIIFKLKCGTNDQRGARICATFCYKKLETIKIKVILKGDV